MDDKVMWKDPANRFQDVEQAQLTTSLRKPVSRRTLLKTGAGLAVATAGAGAFLGLHAGTGTTFAKPPGPGTPNAAIQWNNAALQAWQSPVKHLLSLLSAFTDHQAARN